jgi:catechol 2,3-dioxygenase-like lactoylglutathione lyase family enzyme
VRFSRVTLEAPALYLESLVRFYGDDLQLNIEHRSAEGFVFGLGETKIEFVARPGEPFYHFAALVPGNRFDQALDWIRGQAIVLPDPASGEMRIDYDNWAASACYFHDPAGNIVELIAHRGFEESDSDGDFLSREIIGLSELGLVGDPREMAYRLANGLNLNLWDGVLDVANRLAFVGERARSLILSRPGRGWRPTGRPAELHPLEVVLTGTSTGEVELESSLYRISSLSPSDLPGAMR